MSADTEPEPWGYEKPDDVPERAIDAIEHDPATDHDTPVSAEFHYVSFADADAFAALVQRPGFEYAGTTDHLPAATPFVWATNPGTDEQVLLATGHDPTDVREVGVSSGGERETRTETGYASYLYLAGPAYAAVSLYRDIHERATYMKGEFSPLAPVEDGGEDHDHDVGTDDDADELVTDGGTRSATADTALPVGVHDEDAVGVERAADERGRYLQRTTALDERPAKAVALSEMGFTDSGIAKRIDATEATVTGYLDAVAERYGIGACFPKTPEQRGELNATGGNR